MRVLPNVAIALLRKANMRKPEDEAEQAAVAKLLISQQAQLLTGWWLQQELS